MDPQRAPQSRGKRKADTLEAVDVGPPKRSRTQPSKITHGPTPPVSTVPHGGDTAPLASTISHGDATPLASTIPHGDATSLSRASMSVQARAQYHFPKCFGPVDDLSDFQLGLLHDIAKVIQDSVSRETWFPIERVPQPTQNLVPFSLPEEWLLFQTIIGPFFAPNNSGIDLEYETKCLVREEYLFLLEDILSVHAGNRTAHISPPPDSSEPAATSDIADISDSPCKTMQNRLFSLLEELKDAENGKSKTKGVWITGHPGIGKTISLCFIMMIRLFLRLPTLLISKEKGKDINSYYFDGTKFCRFYIQRYTAHFTHLWPKNLWVLVDFPGGELVNHTAVDTLANNMEAFFVISASSNTLRQTSVQQRVVSIDSWYMKPPPLTEILLMHGLQANKWAKINQLEIQRYVEHFLPVPRQVFSQSADIFVKEDFESVTSEFRGTIKRILADTGGITLTDIVLASDASYVDQIHHIFLTVPGDRRNHHTLACPGHALVREWRQQWRELLERDRLRFYNKIASNEKSRVLAGMFLEDYMHLALQGGHPFELHEMEREPTSNNPRVKNLIYKRKGGSTRSLMAGLRPQLELLAPPIAKERWTKEFQHGIYYRPICDNTPLFDSLILEPSTDSQLHAMIFQSTASVKKHPGESAIDFLQTNFQRITYVFVHDEYVKNPQLHIPRGFDALLNNRVYHTTLDSKIREQYGIRK